MGWQPRRSAVRQQAVLLRRTTRARTTRRSTAADARTCRPRPCAPATSAARRSPRRIRDTGEPFAESDDSRRTASIRRRRTIMDFFYPLPNQGTLANGYGVFQQFVPETRKRHRADLRLDSRGDARTIRCSSAAAISTATRTASPSRRGNALTNLPILDYEAQHRVGDRRAGRRSLGRRWSTSSGPATTTTTRSGRAHSRRRTSRPSSGSRTPRA